MTDNAASTPTPSGRPDPRPPLLASMDQVGRLMDQVFADDLARSTPCTEYDVSALLSHLVAVSRRIAHIAAKGHFADVPSVADLGDRAGDPAAYREAWAAGTEEVRRVLADDAVLEGRIEHPAGTMPAPQALYTYVSETAVHGWDLAAATGQTGELDDSLAAAVLGPMKAALPAEREEWMPFAAPVPVADDASAYDQLVAWTGRDPEWTA